MGPWEVEKTWRTPRSSIWERLPTQEKRHTIEWVGLLVIGRGHCVDAENMMLHDLMMEKPCFANHLIERAALCYSNRRYLRLGINPDSALCSSLGIPIQPRP